MLKKILKIILEIIVTVVICWVAWWAFFISYLFILSNDFNEILSLFSAFAIPLLLITLVFPKKIKKKSFIVNGAYTLIILIALGINFGIMKYDESITINTDVNINVNEYMPFVAETKIAKLDNDASLKLTENLPILDGAAAAFPLYSAFVNAVYPSDVKYNNVPFLYSNTTGGYKRLADKEIDIFFGAYPSEEQINDALMKGTEFEYTEIGKEGFVFFVNKNNPVENLTLEEIRGIYSGRITNWKDVGGKDEEIVAFQRNKGSGSQSTLIRLMGKENLMEPPSEHVNDFMGGIIESVSDYRNHSNSIGFSFRYYLEEMIANPNVKMLKIDGVAPTKENITEGTYPIIGSLYAVTYKGNSNENVDTLINWFLSEEGQELVEKTGYARVK